MATKIQIRRDTTSNWSSANPVLSSGELGINLTTGQFKIGDGSTAWNSLNYFVGYLAGGSLDDLSDVTITSAAGGDFLRWNGTAWINDAVNLGSDTVGNYISDVTAGTGVSVTHTPGEGSSPTISIGQAVGTSDSPTFANVNLTGAIVIEGATADTFETTLQVTDPTADRNVVFQDASGTVALLGTIALGTDTTGDYVSSLVAGTGVTLSDNSGEGSTPTVSIGQSIGTTDSPTFAGITADNVKVGITTANTIDVASGGLTIDAIGIVDIGSGSGATNTGVAIRTKGSVVTSGDISLTPGFASGTDSGATGGITEIHGGGAYAEAGNALAGSVVIQAGMAYGATSNTGGDVRINAGSASGGMVSTPGSILIGTLTSGPIEIGKSGGTTTVNGELVISGSLTVNGTTTTVNTETLNISDNIIILNNDVTGTPTQNAGIEVERGTSTNVLIRWNETSDKWQLTNDGTTYGNIATGQEVETTSSVTFGSVFTPILGQNGSNLDINATNVTINTGANLYDDNGTVTIGGSLSVSGAINGVLAVGTRAIIFEGDTDDAYETEIYAADPTDDRTITFPDASGTVALTSDTRNIEIKLLMEVM